jgi:putative DNA primase/helicase
MNNEPISDQERRRRLIQAENARRSVIPDSVKPAETVTAMLTKPFPPKPAAKREPDIPERSTSTVPFSEDALALEFTARHGEEFRYVSKWGKWMHWTGKVWQEESTMLTFDLARQICRDNCDQPGVTEPIKKTLAQASTVAAVVKLASADRKHAARHNQWDTSTMQLNTPDGVLDLVSGDMLEHDPRGYHSKMTAIGPSNTTPERWLQFLDQIFEDQSIITYLQRVCGYCLTGSTQEHALFFCYGTGKNGKSTFTRTVSGILNDYSREASLETFTESRNEQHPTGLAALKGARLALIRETEKNSYWAESQLKQVTGGDRITARYMRQDFFDFTPEFKLLINGNHKPRLRSVDEAIRRRMNLIPFAVTIPEDKRETDLYEKLVSERPAILHWMLEGCLAWQTQGLAAPECVLSATADYLEAEDKLGLWLAERCVMEPRDTTSSSAAFEDWKTWCEEIGEHSGSQRAFSQELETREGIRKNPERRAGRGFIGFSLKADRPAGYGSESQ